MPLGYREVLSEVDPEVFTVVRYGPSVDELKRLVYTLVWEREEEVAASNTGDQHMPAQYECYPLTSTQANGRPYLTIISAQ